MSTIFGDFLKEKRKDRHFTVKVLANLIGKSNSYVSQLESGIRPAPKLSVLEKISEALVLDEYEKREFFDLAEKSRKALSDDLTEYINSHDEVKEAIRVSLNQEVPKEEWDQFLRELKDKFLI